MPSAAALRLQIEAALESRIPGALTPRPRVIRDLAATGIPELDALLEGGLPVGAITELVGPLSSGRTTLTMAFLAELTQAGKTVAWVDASDALDPESAAAAGIDLERQLWVRCGQAPADPSAKAVPVVSQRSSPAFLVEGSHAPASSGGCGSPHPRGEAKGMSQAIDAFLQPQTSFRPLPPNHHYNQGRKDRMVGTPSAPNRKLLDRTPQDPRPFPRRAQDRKEQPPTDRQPSRRQAASTLRQAQIANTAAVAAGEGAWTDNRNNAAGRAMQTAPNAIAAGLPRFREMEARAAGQGHGLQQNKPTWEPSLADLQKLRPKSTHPIPKPGQSVSPALHERTALVPEVFSSPSTQATTGKQTRQPSLAGVPPSKANSPIWTALDQALRATDLLLAAGGFSAIVLDLGNTPPEFAWRIPLATWFRFRAGADRARTVLIVLTRHPCARSSAELVLRLRALEPQAANTVLTGAHFQVTMDRRRFDTPEDSSPVPVSPAAHGKLHLVTPRKQPQRARDATWHRKTAWTGASR